MLPFLSYLRKISRNNSIPQFNCRRFYSYPFMDLSVSLHKYSPHKRHQRTRKNLLYFFDQYRRSACPHCRSLSCNSIFWNTRVLDRTSCKSISRVWNRGSASIHPLLQRTFSSVDDMHFAHRLQSFTKLHIT